MRWILLLALVVGIIGCDTSQEVGTPSEIVGAPAAPSQFRIIEVDTSFQDVFNPRDVPALRLDWDEYRKGGVEGVHVVLYVQNRNGERYANYPVRMVKDPNVHVWQTPSTYSYLGDVVYVSDDAGRVSLWASLRVGDAGSIVFDVGRTPLEIELPNN